MVKCGMIKPGWGFYKYSVTDGMYNVFSRVDHHSIGLPVHAVEQSPTNDSCLIGIDALGRKVQMHKDAFE